MHSLAVVTGATGFVGGALARRLDADGVGVRLLVRASSDVDAIGIRPESVFRGDLDDPELVADAVGGADFVYHLAARNDLGAPDPDEMRRANVDVTRCVLAAAAAAGVPALHCSSLAALGPTRGPQPAAEDHWAAEVARVTYAQTKREAHLVARRLAADGAALRIASPGGVYGPGDNSPLVDMMARVVRGVPVGYMARNRQSFVNVEDCADALVRVARAGEDGREYVVVADSVTFHEFWTTLARVSGHGSHLLFVPAWVVRASAHMGPLLPLLSGLDPAYVRDSAEMIRYDSAYSGARMRSELAWSPRSLADGLAEVAAWLRGRDGDEARGGGGGGSGSGDGDGDGRGGRG